MSNNYCPKTNKEILENAAQQGTTISLDHCGSFDGLIKEPGEPIEARVLVNDGTFGTVDVWKQDDGRFFPGNIPFPEFVIAWLTPTRAYNEETEGSLIRYLDFESSYSIRKGKHSLTISGPFESYPKMFFPHQDNYKKTVDLLTGTG